MPSIHHGPGAAAPAAPHAELAKRYLDRMLSGQRKEALELISGAADR